MTMSAFANGFGAYHKNFQELGGKDWNAISAIKFTTASGGTFDSSNNEAFAAGKIEAGRKDEES
jgi:hypothetical protein